LLKEVRKMRHGPSFRKKRLRATTFLAFLAISGEAFCVRRHIAGRVYFKTTSTPKESTCIQIHPSNSCANSFQSTTSLLASENDNEPVGDENSLLSGILVLLTVPIAWGTYVPVVRYLYEIQPPVPGFVFSACYYTVAAVTTGLLAARQDNESLRGDNPLSSEASPTNFLSSLPINGGIELGSYLFIANCLQIIGLRTVASDRAGFLVQLTTVFVPFVEALFAGNLLTVPVRTWSACVLAFVGLVVMGLDGQSELLSNSASSLFAAVSSFTEGDLLIVAAAIFYTLHVVRLGRFAKATTPMKLAATKASWEAFLSTTLVVVLMGMGSISVNGDGLLGFAVDSGKEITSFFSTFAEGVATGDVPKSALLSALGATLWTGWITCAYTIYAQSYGQSRVSPTNANLIYTFQPIFTALFAFLLLGETMGPVGFLGGFLIGLAVYLVASSSSGESSSVIADDTEEVYVNGETKTKGVVVPEEI
jgi:drug/metabolite transporter (DMT)-like permease